ncbi:MAG: BrnT family toxin [Longimicrobiaceae bacterium]
MDLRFEWDPAKDEANERKHGVTFHDASTAFSDPLSSTIPDPDHSEREDRFLLIGQDVSGRLLVVAHTERGDTIRIISARPATRGERRDYEEANR